MSLRYCRGRAWLLAALLQPFWLFFCIRHMQLDCHKCMAGRGAPRLPKDLTPCSHTAVGQGAIAGATPH